MTQSWFGRGFAIAVVVCAFSFSLTSVAYWASLFAGAGLVIAIQDALESTATAEMIPAQARGTAFGVLGSVNGIGDFASSLLVGALWTSISPIVGFGYAAVAMALGALLLARQRRHGVLA